MSEHPTATVVTPDQQLIHDLRKFQADEPGFPQIFSRAADTIEHLSWLAENKNAALKEAMAEVQRLSAAKTSEQGYTEGYAASLRQQAEWINKARAGEMDSNDIDVNEILAAADFIDRSSAETNDTVKELADAAEAVLLPEIEELKEKLAASEERFDDVWKHGLALEAKLAALSAEIVALQEMVKLQGQEIAITRERDEGLEEKLAKCEADRDEIEAGSSHLVARIAELSADIKRAVAAELERCAEIAECMAKHTGKDVADALRMGAVMTNTRDRVG